VSGVRRAGGPLLAALLLLATACGSSSAGTGPAGSSTAASGGPGTPLPARLAPARFPARDGWQTGASAARAQTFTWAATTAFRDPAFSAPPGRTLDALAPGDVLIEVILSRAPGPDGGPPVALPIRLDGDAPAQDFPGSAGTRWFQRIAGAVGDGRLIDVWVFAGRGDPTEAQIAAAQRMLDGLQLPGWPAAAG
jgi:hypothetical protein